MLSFLSTLERNVIELILGRHSFKAGEGDMVIDIQRGSYQTLKVNKPGIV